MNATRRSLPVIAAIALLGLAGCAASPEAGKAESRSVRAHAADRISENLEDVGMTVENFLATVPNGQQVLDYDSTEDDRRTKEMFRPRDRKFHSTQIYCSVLPGAKEVPFTIRLRQEGTGDPGFEITQTCRANGRASGFTYVPTIAVGVRWEVTMASEQMDAIDRVLVVLG